MTLQKKDKNKPGCWLLYILRCRDGTLYTGITNNLERRFNQHNKGTASRYTRSRLPARLVYRERCRDRSSALKKECRMKTLARKEKEEYIKTRQSRNTAAAKMRKVLKGSR